MIGDPIVQEVRQARSKLFAQCDGDLEKLMDRPQASEADDAQRVLQSRLGREKPSPLDGRG